MGLRNLEALILRELREVAKCRAIKQRDIQEWSTGEHKVREYALPGGESVFFLPETKVWVAVNLPNQKRRTNAKDQQA